MIRGTTANMAANASYISHVSITIAEIALIYKLPSYSGAETTFAQSIFPVIMQCYLKSFHRQDKLQAPAATTPLQTWYLFCLQRLHMSAEVSNTYWLCLPVRRSSNMLFTPALSHLIDSSLASSSKIIPASKSMIQTCCPSGEIKTL